MDNKILFWLKMLWMKILGAGVMSSAVGDFSVVPVNGTKRVTVSGLFPLTAGGIFGAYRVDVTGKRVFLDAEWIVVSGRTVEFPGMNGVFSTTDEVGLYIAGSGQTPKGVVYTNTFTVPDEGLVETVDLSGLIDFTRHDSFELSVEAISDENIPRDGDTAVEVRAKGVTLQGANPTILGGNLAASVKRALAAIRRGVWADSTHVQNGVGWDALEAVPYPIGAVADALLCVNFLGGSSIYDPGTKATGTVTLTGSEAAVVGIGDMVSGDGLNFEATEEVTVPSGTVPVVIDAGTDVLAAVGHGFANGTVGRLTAQVVAAVKATASLVVTASAGTLVSIGDLFSADLIGFAATEDKTMPSGGLSVVAVPATEKMNAAAHGYADGTKGQFTAAEVAAVEATGGVVLTGTGGTVIAAASILATALGTQFETDAEVTIPAGDLSVTPDETDDTFGAAGHGYAEGTKGQFTAPYINKATGTVILTGDAESVIAIDDEVSTSIGSIVFKATEEVTVPADGLAVVAVPATDKFTAAAHGYANGTKGQFTGTALPSGIAASTDYFIVNAAENDFQVSLTEGGEVDTFSDTGTDVVFTASVRKVAVAVEAAVAGVSGNVDAAAIDTLSAALIAEGFATVTNLVATSGGDDEMDLPAGITAATDYYLVNVNGDDFQVSLNEGGAAEEFTTNGNTVVFSPSVRKVAADVTAVVGGVAGNVAAHAIDTIPTPIAGVTAVDNPAETTGGVDAYLDLPTGITAGVDYFMVNAAENDFQVSLTEGGDVVEFDGLGDTVVFTPSIRKMTVAIEATVGGVSGNVNAAAIDEFDPLIVGIVSVTNPAAASGGVDEYQLLPTGITLTTDLYMRDRGDDSFKVALTAGGVAVNFADTGTDVVFNPTVRKIDVEIEAEEVGVAYNLDPGDIDTVALTGFSAVTNVAATSGGVDETPEDTYQVKVTIAAR